ncbi:MAG: phosphoadenosine phosphosulfate reductase family protein [Clostridiales bacterium]|jgi:phosphoadenosine phosphosulfate reductase|nr:phosphoadenosine phosphosulfate reductase family protein [Clostridiales bacterium]
MYSYTYDKKAGGLLLNSSPTGFSKEPRPVYASELDVLGFDKYWKYDKQTDYPYMWAEANYYYYRGTLVAKLKGGNIYNAPEIIIPNGEDGKPVTPEPKGISLRPVDIEAMIETNREMLEIIEQTTVKKILAIYAKYKDKLDCFHVAFSGGKDSCVLLDLVKKALPKGSFVVVFGDTGMEFPDTYDVIKKTKQQCVEDEIPFYIAKSHLNPKESWELFGPPSRVLRWCCSVHKSAPQTLKLREITGKDDYTGLAFVGIRAQESATRAEYDYFNDGKKIKGQFSHNSILEWTSAEVWLYIYTNDVTLNESYKKGSARVGCICCPMGGGKASYFEYFNYTSEVSKYFELIKKSNGRRSVNPVELVKSGGWSARKNGRDLANNLNHCTEWFEMGFLTISVENAVSDWREWIKTIDLPNGSYSIAETKTGYIAKLSEEVTKQNPLLSRLFRQVFHKAACCQGCKVCEANCTNGAIRFAGEKVHITGCVQCQRCHAIDSGCLMYHSLRHPQGGGIPMKTLNTMSNHAPKTKWLADFFSKKDKYFSDNSLNRKNQLGPFCRFLRDCKLIDKENHITSFEEIISFLGWETDVAQGLILINLVAENLQVEWYIANFELGRNYPKKDVVEMLLASGVEPSKSGKFDAHDSICYAYKRLVETPLGTNLHWGFVTDDGKLVRTKCSVSDPRVVLYGLFKFAEKCNDYKEFTLATLLNDSIDRDGISPTRIFGLDREDMTPLLLGLSAKYPEFIMASFTHDLEKIVLAEDKSSQDVLDLFKGDNGNA